MASNVCGLPAFAKGATLASASDVTAANDPKGASRRRAAAGPLLSVVAALNGAGDAEGNLPPDMALT
jgi:hypothetical protein